ncbi:MAG: nucleotidyl transferase AbiEii/AbiGii toxin family protein [Saprospiraceae bacterium]|nr:nucleotidyl transferase AbiEii/AbiGii toxin family protein [Saprospiraceae bacterium]
MPVLNQFALVGGTNLSLRFGHRLSIDLDLFTNEPFDTEYIYKS